MRKFILFALLFHFSFKSVYSEWPRDHDKTPFMHELAQKSTYEGDEDGSFVGDPLVMLEDGSIWKVHPQHAEALESWDLGESVHVGYRLSFYWYKREHKCFLYNHDRDEEVFVMPISSPLQVRDVSKPLDIRKFFVQRVSLSDGSRWLIFNSTTLLGYYPSHTFKDLENCPPYILWSKNESKCVFFLIQGTGKHAEVYKVYKI